jgi:1,4-alpha-glucan branching enzyme
MRRSQLLVLLVLAAAIAAGCSSMNFIKRRLPPPTQTPDGVVFRFAAPSAQMVQVMGSWPENDWGRGQAQTGTFLIGAMQDEDGDGVWERLEPLQPGRYQYKFLVDRVNWKEDPNNPNRTDDGFGGFNSLVDVR